MQNSTHTAAQTPPNYPESFDGYLRHAIETDFSYLGDMSGRLITLLCQLKKEIKEERDLQALNLPAIEALGARVVPTGIPASFLSILGPVDMVKVMGSGQPQRDAWSVWDASFECVELCMTVIPGAEFSGKFLDRPKTDARKVLAIIDDGCPFAHEAFRSAAAGMGSRVFAIWDQNSRNPAVLPGSGGASTFGETASVPFGIEYRRATLGSQVGIDDWIKTFKMPDGAVNEEACYREASFETLKRRISHGAHVMDLMAGNMQPKSRFSADPGRPPSFAPATDTGGMDILFVQLPFAAIDDASGAWLYMQVSLAMDFFLTCIDLDPKGRELIVNLSYGITNGAHDGKSILERLLRRLTARYDGHSRGKLTVVVPAGNSRLVDGHVLFKSQPGDMSRTWVWRIPPDNPVEVYVEAWVDKAHKNDVTIQLLPPVPALGPPVAPIPTVPTPTSAGWLFVLPPTSDPATCGMHGDWRLKLTLNKPNVEVHVYVARTDFNMGARIRGKATRFIDTAWEAKQGASAAHTLANGVRKIDGSLICREGTLSGIATLVADRFFVAAGSRLRDAVTSRYSSLGPNRPQDRQGPSFALPTDEAIALRGIRGAGNRSGAVFRLIGTSTAAPMLARRQATTPLVVCPPGTETPDVGCGMKDAP